MFVIFIYIKYDVQSFSAGNGWLRAEERAAIILLKTDSLAGIDKVSTPLPAKITEESET